MESFLRKIQLSEYAIEIYLNLIGKSSFSYYELYRIIPKATIEQFNNCLNELKDTGLLVQLSYEKQDMVAQYSAIPPILPILNYYENININLPDIKKSIQELMASSLTRIFQENKIIELDTVLNTFQEIKKDIDEDSIIQKQEVEDIVEGMEELKEIKEKVSELHQNIKSITQTKFADLIKTINTMKANLIDNIKKKEVVALIEDTFKEKLDNIVSDFTNNLHDQIEQKFEDVSKPLNNITDLIFQYRNDFKLLLLNMLTNFETHMNKIHDLLKENDDNLSAAVKDFENIIAKDLNVLIQNSINEVSSLNKPIENVMKGYLQEISTTKKQLSINIWLINSVTRINEAIQNLISNSKERLTIIIPHIENHIAIEQFSTISSNLKIMIASSEAHTNSIVKNFKNIKNILYRTYQNENLIILKGDNTHIFLGIIQESKDPLNDFIGIGSTFKSLIELFAPLVNDIWEKAYPDTFHASQVVKTDFSKTSPIKPLTTVKPIITSTIKSEKIDKKPTEIEVKEKKSLIAAPSRIQKEAKEILKSELQETKVSITPKPQITDLKQKLKEKIDFVAGAQPEADDKAAFEINNAFNNLVLKLNSLKGDDFGKELQNIADLILEKKGFSVTLHKIRSIINKFKDKLTLLDVKDKKEILDNIENWKQKLY
ncbi:MAG: hypothetical protein ACFFB9_18205 [Promethearchaeota archaeon]